MYITLQKIRSLLLSQLTTGTLLAHPTSDEPLAIVTDISDSSIGAVLQQWVVDDWEPLTLFSRKLSTAESKYGAYDRELLPVYSIIKVLRAHGRGRAFTVFVDHKRLTFVFRLKADKCLPRQFRHLGYIAHNRHNTWKDNIEFSYLHCTGTNAQTRKVVSVKSHTHIHLSVIWNVLIYYILHICLFFIQYFSFVTHCVFGITRRFRPTIVISY